jgi:hypothetical protein
VWGGVALGSAGLLAIGLGAYFGARAASDDSARNEHCVGSTCDAIGLSFADRAHSEATASTVLILTGAAATVGGVVLLITARPPAPASAVAIAPIIAPGGGGLRVVSTW